jgi:hypothetical protein
LCIRRDEVECPAKARQGPQVLIDYCAGTLATDVAASVGRHVEQCEACREFCREQDEVWSALDAWEPEPVSAGFDARLGERLSEADRREWWTWIWRPAIPVAAVAILVVAALLLRSPTGTNTPAGTKNADAIDVDQVEKTLDDIDMLKQLYLTSPPEASGAKQI